MTAIGESRGISADQPPSPIRQDWALSAEASAEVDAILVDPCFYAEPTRVHAVGLKKVGGGEYSIVGGGTSLMEVETGERSRIAEMHFGNWGKTGRLMQLIASRSS